MPIYEYKCNGCGSTFEELVNGFSNEALPCPSCSSKDTEKLMSAPGSVGLADKALPACPSAKACSSNGPCCGGGGCPIG